MGHSSDAPCFPSKTTPVPVSSPIPYHEGARVLRLPELLFPLFFPSTKQLELWFSSLQEDAGQRLKWESMGLLGYEGGRERDLFCWFPLMPERS